MQGDWPTTGGATPSVQWFALALLCSYGSMAPSVQWFALAPLMSIRRWVGLPGEGVPTQRLPFVLFLLSTSVGGLSFMADGHVGGTSMAKPCLATTVEPKLLYSVVLVDAVLLYGDLVWDCLCD